MAGADGFTTKIASCEFPDDLLYEPEGLAWVRQGRSGEVVVGITAIHAALAGKLTAVRPKPINVEYAPGKLIGTLEGGRYFGPIRTPVQGLLLEVNDAVLARPKILSESPYGDGWFARVRAANRLADGAVLRSAADAAGMLASQIAALRVRCFAAFPDFEMYEIGTECAAVLVRLNELLERIEIDDVVHVVSDDVTAPIEMARWSDETGQPVIEERQEGNLFHFLVRKRMR